MNTGWHRLRLTNFVLNGSRIYICDEGTLTGREKWVTIQNGLFTSHANCRYTGSIQMAFNHNISVPMLRIQGVDFDGKHYVIEGNFTAAQLPTTIVFDDVYVGPVIDVVNPRLFAYPTNGGPRDSDFLVVKIYNSNITTHDPPLRHFNPIRVNDEFSNVIWVDTAFGNPRNYSEGYFNATIPTGSSSVSLSHLMPNRTIWSSVQITPTSDLANCTYFWWTWSALTDTQITIYVGDSGTAKNCDDDITFVVKAELKP